MNRGKKRREDIAYWWKDVYQVVIPSIITILYLIYVFLVSSKKIQGKFINDSEGFEEMLKTAVTFMSIVLSVFGFLIPSFITEKEKNSLIKYFIKHADLKLFTVKLKNLVITGLMAVFFSCLLIVEDLFSNIILNCIIFIWMWCVSYFLCSAYRFISIIINLIIGEKKQVVKKIGKQIPEDALKSLDESIKHI